MQTFREFVEQLNRKDMDDILDLFIPFCKDYLKIKHMPQIDRISGEDAQKLKAFGCWDGEKIRINVEGRHPMDVCRTLAHELVHCVKGHTNGEDGSDDENEANAMAGVVMRKFAKAHPELF
jgi:hypothetical protein